MARGRASKATKKFEKNRLGKVIETRKIQKKKKEKYNKNKDRNDARKTAAREIVHKEFAQKKIIAEGKGDLFNNMTMDEFLATPADNMVIDTPQDTQDVEDELEKSHKEG